MEYRFAFLIKLKHHNAFTFHLESGVVMKPCFGSHNNRLAVYVQRSATLIDDTIFTITTKFDDCLRKKLTNEDFLVETKSYMYQIEQFSFDSGK